MKINGISNSGISGIGKTNISSTKSNSTTDSTSPLMQDALSFREIDLEARNPNQIVKNNELEEVLYRLFVDILNNGIAIVATRMRDYGSYVMEASFRAMDKQQATHHMNLPLRGVNIGERFEVLTSGYVMPTSKIKQIATYLVQKVSSASNANDMRRLIIVTTHEFGHFLSWQNGNHNYELKKGLELMQYRMARSNFVQSSAVYREEMLAWNLGATRLTSYGFSNMPAYHQVKEQSLDTYYKQLQLQEAPLEIHTRMSLHR